MQAVYMYVCTTKVWYSYGCLTCATNSHHHARQKSEVSFTYTCVYSISMRIMCMLHVIIWSLIYIYMYVLSYVCCTLSYGSLVYVYMCVLSYACCTYSYEVSFTYTCVYSISMRIICMLLVIIWKSRLRIHVCTLVCMLHVLVWSLIHAYMCIPWYVCRTYCYKSHDYCNTLQHTATHCNTLQHTATDTKVTITYIYIYSHMCVARSHTEVSFTYTCVYREVGGWGRDPKKCTGRDWGMGSSTI